MGSGSSKKKKNLTKEKKHGKKKDKVRVTSAHAKEGDENLNRNAAEQEHVREEEVVNEAEAAQLQAAGGGYPEGACAEKEKEEHREEGELSNEGAVQDNDEEEEEKEEEEEEEGEEEDEVKGQSLESYSDKLQKALVGDLDITYPENVKVVRIFTSSTFTDTSVERNTLMERIYPRIKQFCQEHGYEFQVVDMRWGVRDEATDDHLTSELCMRELRACQNLSTGPNFITFLGQKYGYRPFPPRIPSSEFKKLLSAVDKPDDKTLLQHWFRRDDNTVPAEYLLQPITALLPDYRNYDNEALRKKASGEWWAAFERMQVVLREASGKILTKKNDRLKYAMSVTEDEIRRGIINARNPNKHCFWFKRVITDLKENISSQKAGSFMDKVWGAPGADEPAQKLLNQLRERDLPTVLAKDNVIHYNVKWSENGIDPKMSPEHAEYIEKLCKDFYDQLTKMVSDGIKDNETADTREPLAEEIFQHGSFCQKKCKTFFGRKDVLEAVRQELTTSDDRVVVLHGESGCGKTSLMAKVATEVKSWIEDESVIMVCRFIGTSPNSSSIRPLLRNICQQLCKATEQPDDVPEDMKSLVEYFPECLEKSSENHKIVLVLDSMDQLSLDDSGRLMDWLPRNLPYNVYVVLSTLPGDHYQVLPNLRLKYKTQSLMEVPQIPMDEADMILDHWLKASKRTLQQEQRKEVMVSFKECPLPLYLKLAFDESCRWKSYTPFKETDLAPNVIDMIRTLFDRVERVHGKKLVGHALGYITASKNGLTEPELEDLLSLDDEVLNDVYQYWTPPIRRLPPLLWIRIRADIKDYLIDRGADATRVIYWYHRQFIEVARERYLSGDQAKRIHANMSEYFLGDWADGKKKPYTNKKGESLSSDRLVARQPLMFGSNEEKPIFNLRKLSELPYHLFQSGKFDKMKDETLCNFEFLLTKLRGTSVENVLDDFSSYLTGRPNDPDVKLMHECLRLSLHALSIEPTQLPTQLLGRMYKFQDREEKYPYVCKILKEAANASVSCFLPNQKFLTAPGGALISTIPLGGYGAECLSIGSDGRTLAVTMIASDGLGIRILDYQSGKMLRKFTVAEDPAMYRVNLNILSEKDPNIMVLAGGFKMFLLNTETGQIIQKYQVDDDEWFSYYQNAAVAFADDEKLLVAIARNTLRVWDVASGKIVHDIPIKGVNVEEQVGCIAARGTYAVYNIHKQNTVHFVDLKAGKEVNKVSVSVGGAEAFIKEVKVTSKDQVIVMPSNTLLLVYDLLSAKLIKDITSFKMQDGQGRLQITDDGTKAVSTDMFEVAITDLETGVATRCLRSSIFRLKVITRDANIIISIGQDFLLRVYDRSREEDDENLSDTKISEYQGHKIADQISAMSLALDQRHVVTMATVQMTNQMCVWDALAGKKVRQVKGMTVFPNPIRFVDATRGVGFVYDQQLPNYRVFDFKNGVIERTLEGSACKRMNAFGMIGTKRMLSFSRGRKNLKIWNIETGKVVDIIKIKEAKREFQEMLVSADGSVAVISQYNMQETYPEKTTLPLFVYNTKSRQHKVLEMKETVLSLYNAKISTDGKYLVNFLNWSKPILWDLAEGAKMPDLIEEGSYNTASYVEINTEANVVVGAMGQGGLTIWKLPTCKVLQSIPGETAISIHMTADGKSVISRDQLANTFRAFDVATGRPLATFNTDGNPNIVHVIGDRLVMAVGENPNLMVMRLHRPGIEDAEAMPRSPYEGLAIDAEFKDLSAKPTANDPMDDDKEDKGNCM